MVPYCSGGVSSTGTLHRHEMHSVLGIVPFYQDLVHGSILVFETSILIVCMTLTMDLTLGSSGHHNQWSQSIGSGISCLHYYMHASFSFLSPIRISYGLIWWHIAISDNLALCLLFGHYVYELINCWKMNPYMVVGYTLFIQFTISHAL